MTATAPLGSAAFFGPSLSSLNRSIQNVSLSTARLSSGNRLVNASDDVAALSIASRLQSQIIGVKAAQTNASQGNSFLQVAYGGLLQIRDLLDRMNALATQANSGSLTTSDRTLLQQEFELLGDEIDRIAGNTNFNSINLLDGTVSGANTTTTTSTKATQASGAITFTANPTADQTVIINGVTFTAKASASSSTEFTIGGSATATASNLATVLNASTNTAVSKATYLASGAGVTITSDAGGKLGNQFLIGVGTASYTVTGTATQSASYYTLSGGLDDGLRTNSVQASGSIGDALVNTQSQVQAYVTLTLTGNASNNETLTIDDGNGGNVTFTFKNSPSGSTEIQIGSTVEETLQEIVETVSQYTGSDNYGVRQLEFQIDGSQLIIRNKNVGNPKDFSGANLDIGETLTNGSLSASSFSNGATTGVDTSGVNNGDFVGTLDGFTATYVGADSLTASITVGSHTYTAAITDTTPGSATTYRFNSTNGGYFDVQLASGGLAVTNQSTANTYAARLNAAFSTLDFSQYRNVSNFTGTGGLAAASAEIKLNDFSRVRIKDIQVTAPTSTDATIDFTVEVGGVEETFRANSGIGGSLGKYETLTLTSIEDSNRVLRITNGASVNSFDDATDAATLEAALRDSFGLNEEGSGLDFRVGTDSTDVINVNIGDARTSQLFAGATPSIDTQGHAASAQTTLETAKQALGAIIADVGAYQTRFDAAFNNLENTRISVDQARSNLADTDIAEESTRLATEMLKANAASAVIAQTTRLQSSLLDALKMVA